MSGSLLACLGAASIGVLLVVWVRAMRRVEMGVPILLKFFRGHWCPYCVAELRRLEELRPELDARGVQLVVCTDTPDQIREGKRRHGARAVMLSDHDLSVTRLYGLENTARGLKQPGLPGLSIPTTILVDSKGIVRRIDQTEDY